MKHLYLFWCVSVFVLCLLTPHLFYSQYGVICHSRLINPGSYHSDSLTEKYIYPSAVSVDVITDIANPATAYAYPIKRSITRMPGIKIRLHIN